MNRTLVVALAVAALVAGVSVGGLATDPPAPGTPESKAEPLVGATLLVGLGEASSRSSARSRRVSGPSSAFAPM